MPGAITVTVPLRWRDMDAYGHVNNSDFFTLFEQARVQALPLLRHPGPTGLVVARHEIEYLRQLAYRPTGVTVRMWCTRIGGAGFDLGYELVSTDEPHAPPEPPHEPPETVHAQAETTMVSFDFTAETPRRLQPAQIAALREMSGPPVRFRRRAATR